MAAAGEIVPLPHRTVQVARRDAEAWLASAMVRKMQHLRVFLQLRSLSLCDIADGDGDEPRVNTRVGNVDPGHGYATLLGA